MNCGWQVKDGSEWQPGNLIPQAAKGKTKVDISNNQEQLDDISIERPSDANLAVELKD